LIGFPLPVFALSIIQGRVFYHPDKPIFGFLRDRKNHFLFVQTEKSLLAKILSGFFAAGDTVRYTVKYRKYRIIELTEFR
jgi:hypothetical protein